MVDLTEIKKIKNGYLIIIGESPAVGMSGFLRPHKKWENCGYFVSLDKLNKLVSDFLF